MSLRRWSALILAAGAGRRFGGGKLLADLAGEPVIRRVAVRVMAEGFADVVVVTGADAALVKQALEGQDCRIVHAPGWDEGMAASLRTGVAALRPDAAGVCVFLGDMPSVPVRLCADLAGMAEHAGYAARPRYQGKPGHPVAFTRAAFGDLMALQGDTGATALLKARSDEVAYCDSADAGVLLDIDTPSALAAARLAWKA